MDYSIDRYFLQDMQYSLRAATDQLKKYEAEAELVKDLIAVCKDILDNGYKEDRLLAAVMRVETTYVANTKKS